MDDMSDSDDMHTNRVCKDFEIKNYGEYDDLYIQINTFLLADVFENFPNVCLEIYELNTAWFIITAPKLAWQTALKKTKVKLDLLINIYVNGRKRYRKWDMSCYLLICKS